MRNLKWHLLVIMLLCGLVLSAQTVIPDEILVTYDAKDKKLKTVLSELASRANITIAYQDEIIPADSLINVAARVKPLGLVIDQVLENSGVRYKIVGNQIVLVSDIYSKKKVSKDKLTISGYLKDEKTGEFLVEANIFLYDHSAGTTTNEYGFYSFTIPKGLQRIYFSYAGYQQTIKEIKLVSDLSMDVELKPYVVLNEVVITDTRISEDVEEVQSQDVMKLDRMNAMLPLGGEPDVLRLSHFMPGVNSGADGFGGLSVRGGSIDQNIILLDGVPIYNPNHALGLYSVFNSNIIKSTKLIKGSFPAKYGGMLSSVLDVRTREGNTKKLRGDIGLGLLALKASIEGPLGKNSSFLVSGRRTFSDIWISSVTKYLNEQQNKEGEASYYFYDINVKFNAALGKHNHFYFSLYNGKDDFNNNVSSEKEIENVLVRNYDELIWNWSNTLISARLNTRLSKKAFLNSTLYTSNYSYQTFDHERFEQRESEDNLSQLLYLAGLYSSGIRDLGFRMDLDLIPTNKHLIRTGLNFITHQFTPGLSFVNQNQNLIPEEQILTINDVNGQLEEDRISGTELQLFFEDQISVGKYSTMSIGFHQAFIYSNRKSYILPQPRVAFISDREKFVFKTGFSFVSQYMHLLSNSGLGVPADIWLPSTENVEPQRGWVYNAAIKRKLGSGTSIGLEVFYKKMEKVVQFNEGGFLDINDSDKWDINVPSGKGKAYGLELSATKSVGKFSWLFNYTWSKSTRQFDDINNGQEFLYRYDRRHSFKSSLLFRINENAEFAVNYFIASGNPISLPTDVTINYDSEGNPIFIAIYPGRNNAKLPDYHRLDLGFNFYNKLKYGRQKITLGVYNAYNRTNPYYYDLIQDDVSLNSFELNSVSILPFLPTVSYSLSFN